MMSNFQKFKNVEIMHGEENFPMIFLLNQSIALASVMWLVTLVK